MQWVIVGGESGRRPGPWIAAWARDLRDQCVAAGVPFFLKRAGGSATSGAVTRRCWMVSSGEVPAA
ncbi:MAG: DUF5131 family protein [bacterium]